MSGRCSGCNAVFYDKPSKRVVKTNQGLIEIEEDLCRECLPVALNPDLVDWKWRSIEDLCKTDSIMDSYTSTVKSYGDYD